VKDFLKKNVLGGVMYVGVGLGVLGLGMDSYHLYHTKDIDGQVRASYWQIKESNAAIRLNETVLASIKDLDYNNSELETICDTLNEQKNALSQNIVNLYDEIDAFNKKSKYFSGVAETAVYTCVFGLVLGFVGYGLKRKKPHEEIKVEEKKIVSTGAVGVDDE